MSTTVLAVESGYAFLIYTDGSIETSPVQVGDGTSGEITVQLPETVTAAGLSTKLGYSLDAWIGADGTEYEPGTTITLAEGSTTTLSVKWSLNPPTINVLILGTDAKYDSATDIYSATYEKWSSSKPWAFQITVSHPLQAQADFGCRVYHNDVNIHTSVTNWWGNNRNPSATSDDLACSLNAVGDTGSYYAISAIQWATGAGVTEGYTDGTIRPLNTASRAHAAVMLQRFCEDVLQ